METTRKILGCSEGEHAEGWCNRHGCYMFSNVTHFNDHSIICYRIVVSSAYEGK